ncbi:hypothetical protein MKFW12EY_34280 [Methylomonas koyamae]|nr:hypothetical protein MKFW12EY_34280 [Methylomonas koyamae]
MTGRRDTQQAHERAQVGAFIVWLNTRYRAKYKVVAEPNPPEAIIRSGRTTRWVEVTDAFWSDAFAQDEYSYATPGEKHRSIGNGPFMAPDAQFAERFVDVVRKKLEKKSYVPSMQDYGPGYLVVPIMYPLFNSQSLWHMKKVWSQTRIEDLGCFRGIYMSMQMGRGPIVRWSEYGRSQHGSLRS